ncbi:hypothetical protein [Actinomadura chibensis]|uniref:hypothetical protein n=1 Tax=Actinomadura chibensis TaxID=392828 RepID=UPI000B160A7D|nr:hypothetical protein [Actinomadura chibensis]
MGSSLTLPVPETLYATYALALPAPISDPAVLARDEVTRHTRPPLRELVLGMLDSPMLTLDQRPASGFPPLPRDLLAAYGAAAADLAAVDGAAHLLAVRAAFRPGRPPAHEWAARAIAGALGAAVDAPVIDAFTPQILGREHLRRSLPGPDGAVRLTDWMLLPHTSGPRGFFFTTKGLGRYGLPELQTEDVPGDLVEPWGRLLNGLAHRVLDLWLNALHAGALVVDVPEVISVGRRDIAAAQGTDDPEHGEVSVRLRLDKNALTVLPAGGDPATGTERLRNGGNEAVPSAAAPQETAPDSLEALCDALFGTPEGRR